jgi:hypothetical protein
VPGLTACPLHARCLARQQAIQSRREAQVSIRCGVQVDAGRTRTRVSHAGHEIRKGRSGLRGQGAPPPPPPLGKNTVALQTRGALLHPKIKDVDRTCAGSRPGEFTRTLKSHISCRQSQQGMPRVLTIDHD